MADGKELDRVWLDEMDEQGNIVSEYIGSDSRFRRAVPVGPPPLTDPTTAADRLRRFIRFSDGDREGWEADLDEALAEAAAPYRTALERLVGGYQPIYNGRPSCPFCENFVDEEETHTDDCLLIALLRREVGK